MKSNVLIENNLKSGWNKLKNFQRRWSATKENKD